MNHSKCWYMDSCPSIRCAHTCFLNWTRLCRQLKRSFFFFISLMEYLFKGFLICPFIYFQDLMNIIADHCLPTFYWVILLGFTTTKDSLFHWVTVVVRKVSLGWTKVVTPAMFNGYSHFFPVTYTLESSAIKVKYLSFLHYCLC